MSICLQSVRQQSTRLKSTSQLAKSSTELTRQLVINSSIKEPYIIYALTYPNQPNLTRLSRARSLCPNQGGKPPDHPSPYEA